MCFKYTYTQLAGSRVKCLCILRVTCHMRSGVKSSPGDHHLSTQRFQVLEHFRFRRFKLGIFASSVAVFTSLQQTPLLCPIVEAGHPFSSPHLFFASRGTVRSYSWSPLLKLPRRALLGPALSCVPLLRIDQLKGSLGCAARGGSCGTARPAAFSQATAFHVAVCCPVHLITRIISKNVCWALTFPSRR